MVGGRDGISNMGRHRVRYGGNFGEDTSNSVERVRTDPSLFDRRIENEVKVRGFLGKKSSEVSFE